MQILGSIGTVGASLHIGEILPLCDFFDCPVLSCPFSRSCAQVEYSSVFTDTKSEKFAQETPELPKGKCRVLWLTVYSCKV